MALLMQLLGCLFALTLIATAAVYLVSPGLARRLLGGGASRLIAVVAMLFIVREILSRVNPWLLCGVLPFVSVGAYALVRMQLGNKDRHVPTARVERTPLLPPGEEE